MADLYVRLSYQEYKDLEAAIKACKETLHTSTGGYYHKSIRLPVGDGWLEFHGPIVKGEEAISTGGSRTAPTLAH